jgi:hypothetical protein
MQTTYTTRGCVRGRCGHKHRTITAAQRCCRIDQRGCSSQGGYSDRSVEAVEDGETRELTEGEFAALLDATD